MGETRAASDILSSLLRAVEHFDRMGWLDELPDDERASLVLLLDEAREHYAPRSVDRDTFASSWRAMEAARSQLD